MSADNHNCCVRVRLAQDLVALPLVLRVRIPQFLLLLPFFIIKHYAADLEQRH